MAKLTKVAENNIVVNVAHKDAVNILKLQPTNSVSFRSIHSDDTIVGMEATMALMLERAGVYTIELTGDTITRFEVEIK